MLIQNSKLELRHDFNGLSLLEANLFQHISFYNSINKRVASCADFYSYFKSARHPQEQNTGDLFRSMRKNIIFGDVVFRGGKYGKLVYNNNSLTKLFGFNFVRNLGSKDMNIVYAQEDYSFLSEFQKLELHTNLKKDVLAYKLNEDNSALLLEQKSSSLAKEVVKQGYLDDSVYTFLKILFDTNDSKNDLLHNLAGFLPSSSDWGSRLYLNFGYYTKGSWKKRQELVMPEEGIVYMSVNKTKKDNFSLCYDFNILGPVDVKGCTFHVA